MSKRRNKHHSALVPRIQKYMESNREKTYIDINEMTNDLQRSYREYHRLKRRPFMASVKAAYSIVMESFGLEDQENSSSFDNDESNDSNAEASGFGGSGSRLIHNYSSPPTQNISHLLHRRSALPKLIDQNELINISSGDSEDSTNDKSDSGPSTLRQIDNTVINNLKKDSDSGNSASSSAQSKMPLGTLQEPSLTFKNLGGMDDVLVQLRTLLMRMVHPNFYKKYNASKPRNILLHGPPGCGKTLLAHAIAGQLDIPLVEASATEMVSRISDVSDEQLMKDLFIEATCLAPSILFIDKVDAISSSRKCAHNDLENRIIVIQLTECLDAMRKNPKADRVMVIGATDRLDSIDPALRRTGRFDREINIGMPNTNAREQILKVLTADKPLAKEIDFKVLANATPGFVGSDLVDLVDEAVERSATRLMEPILEHHKLIKAIAALSAEKSEKKPKEAKLNAAGIAATGNQSDLEIVVIEDEPKKQPSGGSGGAKEPLFTSSPALSSSKPANATGGGAGSTLVEGGQSPKYNGDDDTISIASELEAEVQEPKSLEFIKPTTISEDVCQDIADPPVLNDEQLSSLATTITMDDFVEALMIVQPLTKREGFATVSNVTWNDVGSLHNIREELRRCILIPAQYPEVYERLDLTTPAGILMCGPPGCGKTLIAKAMANEAGINFISIKGPELFNMYVGESEAVRMCFQRAKNSAPCIIFFDEIESFLSKRSNKKESGISNRVVVNQMLSEIDNVKKRKGVFLLAATNRPDLIDPAVLRPGRFDKILYVGIPSPSERVDILHTITKNGTKPPVMPNVNFEIIGKSDELRGFTGADLKNFVRETANVAIEELVNRGKPPNGVVLRTDHFKVALTKVRPSLTEKEQKIYEKIKQTYTNEPNHIEDEKMDL